MFLVQRLNLFDGYERKVLQVREDLCIGYAEEELEFLLRE